MAQELFPRHTSAGSSGCCLVSAQLFGHLSDLFSGLESLEFFRGQAGDAHSSQTRSMGLQRGNFVFAQPNALFSLDGASGHAGDPGADVFARLIFEIPAGFRAELAKEQGGVDDDRIFCLLEDRASFDVQLIPNLSDDFLEHILEGDDPKHRFVGIDDNRKVPARRPEELHHGGQRGLLEEGQHGTDEGLKGALFAERLDLPEPFLDEDHAKHIIQGLLAHRKPAMAAFLSDLEVLVDVLVRPERHNLGGKA